MVARDPKALTTEQARRDREVLADPDIRGVRKDRRGRGSDDARVAAGNDPKRVERMWKREGRG
jgi:hypothetical protein